ncbi:unnamed protein product [Prorocentrum cordatum]|uniref:Polysaccharide biosynthesis domain-containing protein n=1 Tax=Prorocentrum cordatum TaxID=2364126 RepID=A0ABN9SK41_9DINO|nr:unnamed protein product [Polarella glacialis]
MALAPGVWVLVAYVLPGVVDALYHERLSTAFGADAQCRALTPDGDHYIEQISLACADLLDIRALAGPGAVPAGIAPNRIYRLRRVPTLAERAQYFADGALLAGVAVAPAAPPVVAAAGAPRPGAAAAAFQRAWVVAEDAAGPQRGQVIADLGGAPMIDGNMAMGTLPAGKALAQQMGEDEVKVYANDDLRGAPVALDESGSRRRPFAEAVDLLNDSPPQGGLDFEGVASVGWVLRRWRDGGITPLTRHDTWVRVSHVPTGDRSNHGHHVLCVLLFVMRCVYQLNAGSLQTGELIAMRFQLFEDAHRASPSAPDYWAANHYMGWPYRAGGDTVAPRLHRYVTDQVKGEAEVAKEQSTAREKLRLRRGGREGAGKGREDRTVNRAVSALNELYRAPEGSAGSAYAAHNEAHHQELVDITRPGSTPPDLLDVIDPVGQEMLKDWMNTMLLDQDEWGRVIESSPPIAPFTGVELRKGPELYRGSIGDLHAAGLLSFTAEPKDWVAPFFVGEKSGRLRLVLDSRVPDRRFRKCPALAMGSGVAVGMAPSALLADHGPVPDISEGRPAVLAYCDNVGVGSTSRENADSLRAKIEAQLVADGFEVHEVTVASTSAVLLGREIDGGAGAVQLTGRRRPRLEAALRWFERRPRVSPRQVGIIIGHCIDAATLNPCFMSVFCRCYEFVATPVDMPGRLRAAAAWEFSVFRRPLFACAADVGRPCCSTAGMCDSSLTGAAVATAELPADVVRGIGRPGAYQGSAARPPRRRRLAPAPSRPFGGATREERRANKIARSPPGSSDPIDMTLLEASSISKATQAGYDRRLSEFQTFVTEKSLWLSSPNAAAPEPLMDRGGAGDGEALVAGERPPLSQGPTCAAASLAVLSACLGAALWALAAAAVSAPAGSPGGGRTLAVGEQRPCPGVPSGEQQLGGELLGAVCSHLGAKRRFLVFGNGHDSSMWLHSNPEGTVRFIEDRKEWIDIQSEDVQDVSTLVNYTSSLQTAVEGSDDEDGLREFYEKELPDDVKAEQWDVILVDGPAESGSGDPGLGQSIYAASLLAKPSAHVYVNNCDRQAEFLYIRRWFEQTGWQNTLHGDNGNGARPAVGPKPAVDAAEPRGSAMAMPRVQWESVPWGAGALGTATPGTSAVLADRGGSFGAAADPASGEVLAALQGLEDRERLMEEIQSARTAFRRELQAEADALRGLCGGAAAAARAEGRGAAEAVRAQLEAELQLLRAAQARHVREVEALRERCGSSEAASAQVAGDVASLKGQLLDTARLAGRQWAELGAELRALEHAASAELQARAARDRRAVLRRRASGGTLPLARGSRVAPLCGAPGWERLGTLPLGHEGVASVSRRSVVGGNWPRDALCRSSRPFQQYDADGFPTAACHWYILCAPALLRRRGCTRTRRPSRASCGG